MSSYLLQQKRFSASTLKSYNKENNGQMSMQSSKNVKNTFGISTNKNNLSKSITSKNIQNAIQDSSSYYNNAKNQQILSSSQSLLQSSSINRDSQPLGENNKQTNGLPSGVQKSEGSKHQSNMNSQSNLSYLNGLYNKTKEYSVNKEQIRILEEEKEMKECYFSPKINRRPSHEIVRSLDDFLNDQSKYDSMKKIKQAQLKEQVANEEVKELTLMPRINNSTKNLPTGRDSTIPIHERLFSLQKDQQSPVQLHQHQNTQISGYSSQGIVNSFNGEEQKYFSPRINAKSKSLKRKEPISMILYHDAQRRTEQQQSRSTLGSSSESSQSFIATSEKSEQVFSLNFVKAFQQAWNNAGQVACNSNHNNDQLQQANCQPSSANKIDYLRMNRILENLLFVSQTGQLLSSNSSKVSNPNIAKERSLVYDLWGILKGDCFKGVSKRNLCLFLLSLQGIKNTTPAMNTLVSSNSPMDSLNGSTHASNTYNIPSNVSSSKHYGYFEGENWCVGEDITGIQNKFDLLVKNRLSQQRIRHLSPRVLREQEETEKNSQSTEKHRKSMSKGLNQQQLYTNLCSKIIQIDLKKSSQSPNDYVALLVQQRNMQLKKHCAQKIAEKETELDGCTFQPNLDRCAERIKSPGTGTQKSLALYKMMFKPSSQKRDKSTYDVEYEKQCDQCTFNPDCGLTKDSKFLSSSQQFVNRNVGKSIERIRLARQNSQNTSLMFTRGYHDIPKFDQTTSVSMYSEKKRGNNNSSVNSKMMQPFRSFDESSVINDSKQFMMKSLASDAPTVIEPVNNANHRFGVSASMEWNQSQEWNGTNVNNTNNFMQTTDGLTSLPNNLPQGQDEAQPQVKENSPQERIPLLYVDVNIGKDKQERISIFSGDSAEGLSRDFAQIHNLDEKIRMKLEDMLENQMKEYTLFNSNNADSVAAKN